MALHTWITKGMGSLAWTGKTKAKPSSKKSARGTSLQHEQSSVAVVPTLFHVLAALWVAAMLLFAYSSPDRYNDMLQEDRVVEWGTVWLFLAAGLVGLRQSFGDRRVFDGLVALFCLFIAGEEFSWGQRLFGFGSPEYFLANNFQQEVNLHNLPGSFLKPKWILISALGGYGLLLPLLSRSTKLRRLLARVGATAPPVQLVPWFAASITLLLWYPFTLTGEWVEFLAGGLFLASRRMTSSTLLIALSLALIFGIMMTKVTDAIERDRDSTRTPCATMEVQKLLDDITVGDAATEVLRRKRRAHKRVWTAINDGYLEPERIREFRAAPCSGAAGAETDERRHYAVDPWGMSYWLHVQRISREQQRVVVYSFGPNRRRDGKSGEPSGDDIAAIAILYRK